MTFQPQFNYQPLHEQDRPLTDPKYFAQWMLTQLKLLGGALKGPSTTAKGSLGSTATLYLGQFDLTTGTLSADCAVTLDVAGSRAGAIGYLQLTQDGTGGRAVTWTNALWAASTAPTIATGAGKRTMLVFLHNGTAWVGLVHASNY